MVTLTRHEEQARLDTPLAPYAVPGNPLTTDYHKRLVASAAMLQYAIATN